ncbi:E3 ubiquitin-protein ligase CCNB1IP1 [Turnera subulata]|uniref:E3 ubiquitin-protein ligase CCNB1IP1 n=1 Tax=Turnera subulata TaxID=218843 RepID=A0A9Q0FSU8_9ROSI|nr:E3 ubiquitin-protein ligase CCNB1IP1 [Turnera subulata]
MRCNACWRELEGRAVSTTCGHLFCTEDAGKILASNEATCPICDQVLSRSLLMPVDINPNDEWINMVMAGISPQILMKSAYCSVMFYIGQKELEMQYKMKRIIAQCQQKCEAMQEKFTEKLEEVHNAYQKVAKRCQMMEQEIETLSKDKQELQEKLSEKARQKRKLDEMYDQLRSEYDWMKRSAIQPACNFYPRNEPDLFSKPESTMMDRRDPIRKDWLVYKPQTLQRKEDVWPAGQDNFNPGGPFETPGPLPGNQAAIPVDAGNTGAGALAAFAGGAGNSSRTLRNLILTPVKQPQLSRSHLQMFTCPRGTSALDSVHVHQRGSPVALTKALFPDLVSLIFPAGAGMLLLTVIVELIDLGDDVCYSVLCRI